MPDQLCIDPLPPLRQKLALEYQPLTDHTLWRSLAELNPRFSQPSPDALAVQPLVILAERCRVCGNVSFDEDGCGECRACYGPGHSGRIVAFPHSRQAVEIDALSSKVTKLAGVGDLPPLSRWSIGVSGEVEPGDGDIEYDGLAPILSWRAFCELERLGLDHRKLVISWRGLLLHTETCATCEGEGEIDDTSVENAGIVQCPSCHGAPRQTLYVVGVAMVSELPSNTKWVDPNKEGMEGNPGTRLDAILWTLLPKLEVRAY